MFSTIKNISSILKENNIIRLNHFSLYYEMLKQKSFTLIELMVVIAIIGLLSSIILVTLSRAREKARNVRIVADLRQVRSIAELIYSTYNSYAFLVNNGDHTLNAGAPDPYGSQLEVIEEDITAMQGLESPFIIAKSTTNTYCVSVELTSSPTACCEEGWSGWVCTDFEGATKLDYWCFVEPITYTNWCTPYPEPPPP